MKKEYEILKQYMDESKKTVAVTGAGISYLYGMRRLKESVGRINAGHIFSASYVKKNPEEFYKIRRDAFLDATFVKGPSTVHKQLAKLEEQGKIYGIVTQNLDCLHTIAGSKNVVEFQGSFRDNICIKCENTCDDYQIWNKGHMPRCEKCNSPMMPRSFYRRLGLNNITTQDNMEKAIQMISEADLIIVIGTTGFRSNEYLSKMREDAKLIQINPSSTDFDRIADLNIREDAAVVFESILDE